MGFEDNRFECQVDEDFRCPICQDIIEDPIGSRCEHVFCRLCINQWLENHSSCPVDRKPLNRNQLCEPSRFFRNFYSKLMIKCKYNLKGCQTICKIESLKTHQNECQFSETECQNGCEAVLKPFEIPSHNCIQYLKSINLRLKREFREKSKEKYYENKELFKDMQTMIIKLNEENSELKAEALNLKLNNKSSETSTPQSSFPSALSHIEREFLQWNTLSAARDPEHKQLIDSLKNNFFIKTSRVENVLLSVDRKYFCSTDHYKDSAQSIGFERTISAPHMYAAILELLVHHLGEKSNVYVWDIGSGSGYLTICMAEMCGFRSKIIGFDYVMEFIEKSNQILEKEFRYLLPKVSFICKDGGEKPKPDVKFDVINIGAHVPVVPQSIIEQLNIGGRIIAPIGLRNGSQQLVTIDKLANGSLKVERSSLESRF